MDTSTGPAHLDAPRKERERDPRQDYPLNTCKSIQELTCLGPNHIPPETQGALPLNFLVFARSDQTLCGEATMKMKSMLKALND